MIIQVFKSENIVNKQYRKDIEFESWNKMLKIFNILKQRSRKIQISQIILNLLFRKKWNDLVLFEGSFFSQEIRLRETRSCNWYYYGRENIEIKKEIIMIQT
jgi:hypothetical protein